MTIAAANYGRFGRVTETLPDGFSYVSSDLDGDEVSEDGQTVKFTLQGTDITFSYTVTASDTAGTHDFSGTLSDSDRDDHDVGGAASVTVSGASASRSFDTASVAPGGTVTVTIAAANYGRFGRVTETLPDGFSYVPSDDLDGDEVSEDGQTVKFTLQGTDITFSYTVTASDTAGTHDFSGTLRDSDRVDTSVGGSSRVRVATATQRPGTGSGGLGRRRRSAAEEEVDSRSTLRRVHAHATHAHAHADACADACAHACADACAHANDGPSAYGDDACAHANDGPSAYGDDACAHANDGPSAYGDDACAHANDGPSAYANDGSDGPSAYGDDACAHACADSHANSRARCYRGRRRRVASVGEHRDHHRGLGFGRGRWPILPQIEDAIGVGTPEIVKDRGLV